MGWSSQTWGRSRDLSLGRAGIAAPDGIPTVRCLRDLVRALDAAANPPQTLEEAKVWVKEWRAIERQLQPGKIGEVAALWITVPDILAIVRAKKFRDDEAGPDPWKTPSGRYKPSALERLRRETLSYYKPGMSFREVCGHLAMVFPDIGVSRGEALVDSYLRRWLAEEEVAQETAVA